MSRIYENVSLQINRGKIKFGGGWVLLAEELDEYQRVIVEATFREAIRILGITEIMLQAVGKSDDGGPLFLTFIGDEIKAFCPSHRSQSLDEGTEIHDVVVQRLNKKDLSEGEQKAFDATIREMRKMLAPDGSIYREPKERKISFKQICHRARCLSPQERVALMQKLDPNQSDIQVSEGWCECFTRCLALCWEGDFTSFDTICEASDVLSSRERAVLTGMLQDMLQINQTTKKIQ